MTNAERYAAIDAWHDAEHATMPLHDWLGMTWQEYKVWVEDHGAEEPDPSRDPALR